MSLKNRKQIAGYTLSVLMFCAFLNSSYFFVTILGLSIGKWLAFNACSLSIIIYLLFFSLFQITKRDYLLAVPLLLLYYYGTMGLFVMPWNEANMFAQITHIIITANVLWTTYVFIKERKFESLGKGLLIGLVLFVPVIAAIQSYTQVHMNEFMQLLQKM